jgi:hypothetical protein
VKLNLDTEIDFHDLQNNDDMELSDYLVNLKNVGFKTTGMVSKIGSRRNSPSNKQIFRNVRSNSQQNKRTSASPIVNPILEFIPRVEFDKSEISFDQYLLFNLKNL